MVNFKNRALIAIVLFIIVVIVSLIGLFVSQSALAQFLSSYRINFYLLNIANIIGISLLAKTGSIFKTIYWKRISLFFSLAIIGLLAKMQHWEIAAPLLIIGALGIGIIYLIWFIKKQLHQYLDWLKLSWVLSFVSIKVLVLLHYLDNDFSSLSLMIIFLSCIELYRLESKKEDNIEFDFLKEPNQAENDKTSL